MRHQTKHTYNRQIRNTMITARSKDAAEKAQAGGFAEISGAIHHLSTERFIAIAENIARNRDETIRNRWRDRGFAHLRQWKRGLIERQPVSQYQRITYGATLLSLGLAEWDEADIVGAIVSCIEPEGAP